MFYFFLCATFLMLFGVFFLLRIENLKERIFSLEIEIYGLDAKKRFQGVVSDE